VTLKKICVVPGARNVDRAIGGPATFVQQLIIGLQKRGYEINYDLDDKHNDIVFIINATREMGKLFAIKKRGVKIVQRLGSIHQLHKYVNVGVKGYLLGEIRSRMIRVVRSRLADRLVYQSQFVKNVWDRKFKEPRTPACVIYNGVDLEKFNPRGDRYLSPAEICILSVEGRQGNDPFDIGVNFIQALQKNSQKTTSIELLMLGELCENVGERYKNFPFVNLAGNIERARMPYYYRGGNLMISTDIIDAACPNSVLEAMACGVPVIGFRVGALPELVGDLAGKCVDYRGNPWKNEPPGNFIGLASATEEILADWDRYSMCARNLAQEMFSADRMVESYLQVFLE